MKYGVALFLALTLNAAANLMMKFGVERLKTAGISMQQGLVPLGTAIITNWVLMLGLCCFASNVILYTFALKGFPISIAYPIMVSGGFAIISIVAWMYLGETLSYVQWLGVGLILIGVWLVARQTGIPTA
jgi:small multidrug resistance pump